MSPPEGQQRHDQLGAPSTGSPVGRRSGRDRCRVGRHGGRRWPPGFGVIGERRIVRRGVPDRIGCRRDARPGRDHRRSRVVHPSGRSVTPGIRSADDHVEPPPWGRRRCGGRQQPRVPRPGHQRAAHRQRGGGTNIPKSGAGPLSMRASLLFTAPYAGTFDCRIRATTSDGANTNYQVTALAGPWPAEPGSSSTTSPPTRRRAGRLRSVTRRAGRSLHLPRQARVGIQSRHRGPV